jgi:hypothetical protein
MAVEIGQLGRSGGHGRAVDTAARRVSQHVDSSIEAPLQRLAWLSPSPRQLVDGLQTLAVFGLRQTHDNGVFAHTMKSSNKRGNGAARPVGTNLRYAAMVALGLSKVEEDVQRQVLGFGTAADLARLVAKSAETSSDDGAVALAAWAAAEAGHFQPVLLLRRLAERFASNLPVPTVICAWALIAALAAKPFGSMWDAAGQAHKKVLAACGESGLFRSIEPAAGAGRLRAHVGCFADQVYPIMAMARFHAATGDIDALETAENCARRICSRQGPAGQWWWHYDTRTGQVVERFPVYSVHQHAMAPMALLELREAGGSNFLPEIMKGLAWLEDHPETNSPLIDFEKGVIWRKVHRREPRKAARAIAATATAISPLLRIPGLDLIFPPGQVDYECRPYELGWLLYAWRSGGLAGRPAKNRVGIAGAGSGES